MRSRPESWTTLLTKLGLGRKKNRVHSHGKHTRKLHFEQFESRCMLATFMVTEDHDAFVNTSESAGTLRQAIHDADQDDDADIIKFSSSLNGATITLGKDEQGDPISTGALPTITESLTITASNLSQGVTIDASGNDPTPFSEFFDPQDPDDEDDGDGSRVFDINLLDSTAAKDVVFENLAIKGGDTAGAGGIRFDVESNGLLLLMTCYIIRCHIPSKTLPGRYRKSCRTGPVPRRRPCARPIRIWRQTRHKPRISARHPIAAARDLRATRAVTARYVDTSENAEIFSLPTAAQGWLQQPRALAMISQKGKSRDGKKRQSERFVGESEAGKVVRRPELISLSKPTYEFRALAA